MNEDAIDTTFEANLEEVLRAGARRLLQQAIENEVDEHIKAAASKKDDRGRKVVKRNGYLPVRDIHTGIGPLSVKKPRVRGDLFLSSLLPRYRRRIPSVEELIPALYLRGISTGNMQDALQALLGPKAKGLSPANVAKLTKVWEREYASWCDRDLKGKRYVYIWADGIYFNVRLNNDRPCLLVIIGALCDGTKELIAIHDGIRESKLSWQTVLQDLKSRGLTEVPKLAIGDGALGFWAALREEFPSTKEQRCWVHKTANVLDKLPKSVQVDGKKLIHEMYMAPTQDEGMKALKRFYSLYEAKYPKACLCLQKDIEQLFVFYEFPAKHWQSIRTTNPIESTFATIRHRTRQTKGCGSRKATLSMVYKLAENAQKRWKKLRGYQLLEKVIDGVEFRDGNEVKKVA
jgi:transposase-like protein